MSPLPFVDVMGAWLAIFLTLCILSFLYKDNPFYKIAEHLFVGVSIGYKDTEGWASEGWWNIASHTCETLLKGVLIGRAIDACLEPRLTVFGWHHVIGNSLVHFKDFFGQVWKSIHEDLRANANHVRAPTLIAWGARDHTFPLRCAEALREAMPNASVYVSQRGSHDWLIDRAPEFAAALRAFVDATPLVTDVAGPYNPRP